MSGSTRRRFVGLAGACLAAPLLPWRGVKAQTLDTKPPLRFLTIIDSYGLPVAGRDRIWINSEVGDYELADDDLGTVLEPLRPFRENMLVVSGVNMDSLTATGDAAVHGPAACQALTGSRAITSNRGSPGPNATQVHASLDFRVGQYLHEEYGLPSARVYSHLLLTDYAERTKATFSFDSDGRQIRSRATVPNIIAALFPDTGDSSLVAQLSARARLEILGLVGERLRVIRPQLAQVNSASMLDAYQSSVADLANELELRAESTCEAPSAEAAPTDGKDAATTPLIFDTIYHAFACDMVSSVTYAIGGEQINQLRYGHVYQDSMADADLRALLGLNFHAPSHRDDEVARKTHEVVRTYQSQLVAQLLARLADTPDVNATGSILDNTVVFVTSAMSNNTHAFENYPHMLIAGKNTGLVGGMHYDCRGRSNNDLLTTIAQGLSLPDEEFGGFRQEDRVASLNTGPIEKLLRETS